MKTLTIDDVLSLNPCSVYGTREYMTGLFNGRESLSAIEFWQLDIPEIDRLWILQMGGLLPTEAVTMIKVLAAAEIIDKNQVHYGRFMEFGSLYGFGQLAHAYREQYGTTFREEYDRIQAIIVAQVTNYLQVS